MDIYVMKYPMIRCLLLTLFMIGFAYRYPMIHVGKDVSYGVYIYHMTFCKHSDSVGIYKELDGLLGLLLS